MFHFFIFLPPGRRFTFLTFKNTIYTTHTGIIYKVSSLTFKEKPSNQGE